MSQLQLNDDAISAPRKRYLMNGKYVLTSSTGRFLKGINRKSLDRSPMKNGIQNLCHTQTSWRAQNGTFLLTLKELGG